MTRSALVILCALAFALSACSRHHVVERNVGRVDGAKSITTNSDTEWTIQSEPSSGAEDE